ncbi:hypothetical protein [Albidovulum sp.]|jgi:hypothetical protein|uniref:hypothetical protein n=1 Tax=Albidovulum sp. TaxID=1872424 RepID=UPI003059B225
MDSLGLLWDAMASAVIYGLIPLVGISLFCGLGALVLARRLDMAGTAVFFGLVGASLGLLLGASREPAVNVYLPAVITLLGGLLIYALPREETLRLFSGQKEPAEEPKLVRAFVITALAALVISSVLGNHFGATLRAAEAGREREYARWLKFYETVQLPLELHRLKAALNSAARR